MFYNYDDSTARRCIIKDVLVQRLREKFSQGIIKRTVLAKTKKITQTFCIIFGNLRFLKNKIKIYQHIQAI